MKKTTEIQPCTTNLCEVCKQIYDKNEAGVNSLQTLNPDGHIKEYCAKLDWHDDAVAVADANLVNKKEITITKNEIKILKAKVFLDLLHNPKSVFVEVFLNKIAVNH